MCVYKFHKFQLILIALLCLATLSFAETEELDCRDYTPELDAKYNGRCKYYRISSEKPIAKLFVLDETRILNEGTEDERKCSEYVEDEKCAKENQDVKIYVPQAGSKGLSLTIDGTSEQVENLKAMNSGSTGVVRVKAAASVPIDNVHMGIFAPGASEAQVSRVFSFYAPDLKYYIKGEEVTSESIYTPKVGDTIHVVVKAYVTKGPKTGKLDDGFNASLYLDPGDSKYLRYLQETGESMETEKGLLLNMESGVASFMIVAEKADHSDFTVGGVPYEGVNQVNGPFPGDLKFINPDGPTVSGSAIFDANGDGVGDSIRVWFEGSMKFDSVATFKFSWPTGEKLVSYGGTVRKSDDKLVYSLPEVETTLQGDSASGVLNASVCSAVRDECDEQSVAIEDSIGVVILKATLIEGRDGAKDTLALQFSKIVDTSWTQGQGLLFNDKAYDVEAIDKKKKVWKFVMEPGKVSVGDSVKINTSCDSKKCPDGILTAADGIPTAKNNQKVPLDNAGAIYANENNAFYDRDGDGQMDSVSLGLDNPISREALKNMKLTFYWLNSKNELLAISPSVDDMTLSDDGKILGYAVDLEKYDVRKLLTEVDASYYKSPNYGFAVVENTKIVVGDTSVVVDTLGMNDRMPPVFLSNFLYPESFQRMEPDKFTITFTEPVDSKMFKMDGDCLSFLVDGRWVNYEIQGAKWSNHDRTVTFFMESGTELEERMNPADSVRFSKFAGGVQDKFGNEVLEASPAVMVYGDPRVIVKTTAYADLNRAMELEKRSRAFNFYSIEGDLTDKETSSLGVLMNIDFATVLKDSLGISVLDLDKKVLSMELHVYTNLGAYVGGTADEVSCDDKDLFDGNCLENNRKLYVRWNMRSDEGRKVGVGVYLAKFKVKVYGAEKDLKIERIFRWGVAASKR